MIDDRCSKEVPPSRFKLYRARLANEITGPQPRAASGLAAQFAFFFSAKRNDVVSDEPAFTGDYEPHGNAFRFVVVGAMQQVYDSNSRAKT